MVIKRVYGSLMRQNKAQELFVEKENSLGLFKTLILSIFVQLVYT